MILWCTYSTWCPFYVYVGNCKLCFYNTQHKGRGVTNHNHTENTYSRNLCRSVCHVLIPAIDWNTSCRRHRKIPHPHRVCTIPYVLTEDKKWENTNSCNNRSRHAYVIERFLSITYIVTGRVQYVYEIFLLYVLLQHRECKLIPYVLLNNNM